MLNTSNATARSVTSRGEELERLGFPAAGAGAGAGAGATGRPPSAPSTFLSQSGVGGDGGRQQKPQRAQSARSTSRASRDVSVGKESPRPHQSTPSMAGGRQLGGGSDQAAGDFLIYLKDTLFKMESELSSVRLAVQKGVGQVQRERSYYRSEAASGGGSTAKAASTSGGAARASMSSSSSSAAGLSLTARSRALGVDALAPDLASKLAALEQAHDAVLFARQTLPLLSAAAERGALASTASSNH